MRYLVIILALLVNFIVLGQQDAQFSNYQTNNFLMNPAVAGSYNYWNAKVGYRTQWTGMDGGPQTMFGSFHGPIKGIKGKRYRRKKRPHHGFGAMIFSDEAGAISYNGFSGSYALHTHLNRHYTLSFGASVGMKEFRLDGSKLDFVQTPDDPEVGDQIYSNVMPDANVGVWLYSEKMFLGLSARNILQSGIDISNGDQVVAEDYSKLYNHYFITGGIFFDVNTDWAFVPSVMVQHVRPAPVQFDLNGTFWFREKIALGFSYRNLDALYVVFEYVHDEKFEFSYAFDFTISELTKYNNGTHEVVIGMRFGAPRGKVLCPAKFW